MPSSETLQLDQLIPERRTLKLGIIGGLGARAGADILHEIVKLTPVKSEEDHREISFEQKPLVEPISVAALDYSPTHRKFHVFDALTRMEKNACDAALLPCFITHTFIDELRAEVGIKLVAMTEAISEYLTVHHSEVKRIGVLTTRIVRSERLFDNLVGKGVQVIYPDALEEEDTIQAFYGSNGFKAGNCGSIIEKPISVAIENLVSKGAEIIVPGMTEIPLLLVELSRHCPVPILNTNQIYARFALEQTSAKITIPFKVGVVGGVGPAATIDFMSKIVNSTHAKRDQEHIKLLIEHNPQIPDRTENLVGEGTDPIIALYATCKKLERGGANIIAIPCNTAHAFTNKIQRNLDVPIVSILEETVAHIVKHYPKICSVGILATTGTLASNLYQEALQAEGLVPVCPDGAAQAHVMDAIYGERGVKAGYTDGLCREQILQAIQDLTQCGADCIILGCTELPLIALRTVEKEMSVFLDPTQILADKCVELSQMFAKR